MTEPNPYDLAAIRKLLLTALNAQELREIFCFAKNPDLGPVAQEFADGGGLSAMVTKAVSYCERNDLLRDLQATAKQKPSHSYARVEAKLAATSSSM